MTFAVIIGLFIGFGFGYSMGWINALDWGLKRAVYFLNLKGIEIDVNTNLLANGIYRYQNNIGGCWNFDNGAINLTG